MKRDLTILFSSAGRRVELIQCFRRAAKELSVSCRVVAVDMEPGWSPACQTADASFAVPRCSDASFMPAIQKICRNENVRLIVPTIDTELMVFSENSASFAKKNIRVVVPPPTFVTMARDKMETARFLKTCGVATPQTWLADDPASPPPTTAYPLIAKPRHGSASIGVQSLANNAERLRFLASLGAPDKKNYVLQTLCTGRELTVNAFYRQGKLVCAVPHYRKFVRAGEVCFAETVACPAAQTAAAAIAQGFAGLAGVICFQGFENAGAFQVTEINARLGGGYPLADAAGGRFARWLIQDTLELTPDDTPEYQVGLRMLRYDAAVFVPPSGKK